jgi:hypothetical protein
LTQKKFASCIFHTPNKHNFERTKEKKIPWNLPHGFIYANFCHNSPLLLYQNCFYLLDSHQKTILMSTIPQNFFLYVLHKCQRSQHKWYTMAKDETWYGCWMQKHISCWSWLLLSTAGAFSTLITMAKFRVVVYCISCFRFKKYFSACMWKIVYVEQQRRI